MATKEGVGPARGLRQENLPPRSVESSWWSEELTTLPVGAPQWHPTEVRFGVGQQGARSSKERR